jgi:uncharacterized protein
MIKRSPCRTPLVFAFLLLHALLANAAGATESKTVAQDGLLGLRVGEHPIRVMVAHTMPERMVGLMYRTRLEPDQGMLFVYPEPALHAMWMKNTALPLSVAFIDERGVVINIEEMEPRTLNAHAAARPAKFSLEMNSGWFAKRSIKPGALVTGLESVPPGE